MNFNAWLIGRYVCSSISACFGKNHKYPEEPYKSEEDREEDGEVYKMTDASRFEAYAIAYNFQNKNLEKSNVGGGVM